ncbi:hypothetical protein HPB48_024003 [Haemaphysalis longicornis]|uniref:Uncharacterized protein n=1 Tax=Haemaphysalis longicornis TaxID=44386 RepID=A0A9J6H7R6_HAELO|nr:hypothetical protein HPB48_024003 [Haemaphysalis longicornis]
MAASSSCGSASGGIQQTSWMDDEVHALIRVREDHLGDLRRTTRNRKVYIAITAKCTNRTTGTGSPQIKWPFYKEIHKFLHPIATNDTSRTAESECGNETVEEYQPSLHDAGGIVDNVTAGEEQNSIDEFVPAVADSADLESTESRKIFKAHVVHLQAIDADEREQIRLNTVGPAENHECFLQRTGRITASMFKHVINCHKTRIILKDTFHYGT